MKHIKKNRQRVMVEAVVFCNPYKV